MKLRLAAVSLAVLAAANLVHADPPATQPATQAVPTTRPAEEVQADLESFDFVWTTLRDRYYDPDMRGVDWEAARDELRPRVAAAESRDEAREHIQALLNKLGESHLVIIPAEGYDALQAVAEAGESGESEQAEASEGGQGETGLRVRATELDGQPAVVVVDVIPGTPAEAADIRPGAIIERVDGKSLSDLVGTASEAMPERLKEGPMRQFILNMAAQSALDGGADSRGTSIEIAYDQGHGEQTATLERAEPTGVVTQLGHLPPTAVRIETRRLSGSGGGGGGPVEAQYTAFSNFLDPVRLMGQLREAVREAREDEAIDGFVLDLRGNTGGLLGMGAGVAGLFVNEPGYTLGTMTQRQMTLKNVIFPQKGLDKPIAVLVDASSASMSEILAGGLQDLAAEGVIQARVFGRRTAGAALPSQPARLPNGDGMIFVIADHVLPSGRRLEGVGVEPDVIVPLDEAAVETYRAGGDPALEAALEWIEAERK